MATVTHPPRMVLHADTAAELMNDNPISIEENATVRDALNMMLDRDVTAAPVINAAGRPVGVVTVTDILVHEREVGLPVGVSERVAVTGRLKEGYEIELADHTTVDQIMTPGIFSTTKDRTAGEVVADLLRYRIHHLFVMEKDVIVGVISTSDVLRMLKV
jgi:CBS domain-containing protein